MPCVGTTKLEPGGETASRKVLPVGPDLDGGNLLSVSRRVPEAEEKIAVIVD